MSTRAMIRIKESVYLTSKDIDERKLTERMIEIYHHSDGYPSGIGADLIEYLRNHNDSVWKDREVTWDAESIALDLIRGNILTSSVSDKAEGVHRDMGYVPALCHHGDAEYGYLIDCDKRTLTAYEVDYDRHGEEWRKRDIVDIPDKWKEQPLTLPKERTDTERVVREFENVRSGLKGDIKAFTEMAQAHGRSLYCEIEEWIKGFRPELSPSERELMTTLCLGEMVRN